MVNERDDAATAAGPELRPLDRRILRLWRASLLLDTALVALAAAAAAWALEAPLPGVVALSAILLLGLGLALSLPGARYRAWGFRVREDDLFLRRGVVWRTTSVVPHSRIQHVDTRRGPLERWLGLARVIVYTAGTTGASIAIPGLAAEEAEMLRDRLVELGVGARAGRGRGGGARAGGDDAV